MTIDLGFSPSENPFVVEHGGFYRRWLSMIDDLDALRTTVGEIHGTTQDMWVPVWSRRGVAHEERGDALTAAGDHPAARRAYLQAKTYYAIARFPGEITSVKRRVSEDCNRAYRKACAQLDPPVQTVEIQHQGKTIVAHYRAPKGASRRSPVPAVLVMCGADVFKEDRGWAQDMCIDENMASLVMDGPGTGENPFPWSPASVSAWVAAIDWLRGRPEIDPGRVGAFGISRGGYSVMQLAGTAPEAVGALVAVAGHPFGYRMTDQEMEDYVAARNERSNWRFGAPDDPPSFPSWSKEKEDSLFSEWALSEQGLLDRITMPALMINGKLDHLAPIGNIYFMLEHGPATGKEARVYADAGHCAFKFFDHWAADSFRWLRHKLSA